MAFQLKISKGSGEGKVFSFAEKEARIGRTPENDIIVKDGGVSRNHARVFAKAGKYFVEDLKSSNGTRLNGTTIAGPRELRTGDSLTIGDVSFDFIAVEETRIARDTADDVDEDVSGEPTSPGKAALKRGPTRKALEEPEEDEAPPAHQAVDDDEADPDDFGPTTAPAPPNTTRKIEVRARRSPPSALAKMSDEALKATTRMPKAPDETLPAKAGRGASAVAPAAPESAADRARRRRDASQSVVGKALFAYGELSAPGKATVLVVLALVVAGGLGGTYYALRGEGPMVRGPEPGRLGTGKVTDSFGYGDGVSWSRPDMKIFSFELTSATRAVAVLRYQASSVSQDEVVIMVNGVEQGSIPPDTLDTEAREIELVLRPANLKQRDQNSLMFDNTKNPPGNDPWKIWNLGLEIVPIPEVSPEELLRLAEKDATKAREFYELRDVGPDNLFKAWKSYRNAWLTLEGLSQKPELYDLVRAQMKAITPELDRKCRVMMLEAQRQIQFKKRKKARAVLDDIPRYFPTREHRCAGLAREKIEEYEL